MKTSLIPIPEGIVPTPTIYTLSTEHSSSSYGIPVLVGPDGVAYGPGDIIPTGETAKTLVERIERGEGALFDFADGRARAFAEGLEFAGDCERDPVNLLAPHPFIEKFCIPSLQSMKHTPEQIAAAKALINAKLAVWNACYALEKLLGFDVDSNGDYLEETASDVDDAAGKRDAADYLDWLKEADEEKKES